MTTGTDSTARPAEATPRAASCWTFLPLSGKYGTGRFSMLDAADARALEGRPLWFNPYSGYVTIQRDDQPDNLHREILGLQRGDGTEIDHINRDRLDNRRCNLRFATSSGNSQNAGYAPGQSGYRGVSRNNQKQPGWMARVTIDKKCHYLGTFATPEEAARVARGFRANHMPYATD